MKRVSFDRVAERYDETRELPEDVMERAIDFLCEEMPSGSSLIDIGSGTGRFALPLEERGVSVTGIDISLMMIDASRSKGFNRCVRGDSSFLPFREGTFDFALAVHVLHLIEDWRTTLSEIRRVIRDSLLSVVIEKEFKWSGESYHDLLRKRGYDRNHPGEGEGGLAERVNPRSVKYVGRVMQRRPATHVIDRLESRCFSSQWEVPEDLHKTVIAEMREKYSGEDFMESYDVYVCRWKSMQLEDMMALES